MTRASEGGGGGEAWEGLHWENMAMHGSSKQLKSL